jgi:hypothetical protein
MELADVGQRLGQDFGLVARSNRKKGVGGHDARPRGVEVVNNKARIVQKR